MMNDREYVLPECRLRGNNIEQKSNHSEIQRRGYTERRRLLSGAPSVRNRDADHRTGHSPVCLCLPDEDRFEKQDDDGLFG